VAKLEESKVLKKYAVVEIVPTKKKENYMASVNNRVPTRTNYVPTTTQQPTNTKETSTANTVTGVATSVPTPTIATVVMYTAKAPKTKPANDVPPDEYFELEDRVDLPVEDVAEPEIFYEVENPRYKEIENLVKNFRKFRDDLKSQIGIVCHSLQSQYQKTGDMASKVLRINFNGVNFGLLVRYEGHMSKFELEDWVLQKFQENYVQKMCDTIPELKAKGVKVSSLDELYSALCKCRNTIPQFLPYEPDPTVSGKPPTRTSIPTQTTGYVPTTTQYVAQSSAPYPTPS